MGCRREFSVNGGCRIQAGGGPWVDGRELAKGMQDKGTQLKDKQ